MPKLLRMTQVAEYLDIPLLRAYELARKGTLPGVVRIGPRQIRVNEEALAQWVRDGGASQPNRLRKEA